MSLLPLLEAGLIVVIHTIAAICALVVGAVQLLLPKAGTRHRLMGYAWVSLMLVVAASSFWIYEIQLIGPFSPIHLLSLYTLFSLIVGVHAARSGKIGMHQKTMKSLYALALIGAGAFTLLPGRVIHSMIFGQ